MTYAYYAMVQPGFISCLCCWLQVFCEVAYRASSVQNIVDGIDEFLDELIVLPPSIWDPKTRLEPPLTSRTKVCSILTDAEVSETKAIDTCVKVSCKLYLRVYFIDTFE